MNTLFCVDFCLYFCTLSLAYVCGVFNMHIQTYNNCIIASRENLICLHVVMHRKGVGMCVDRYLAGFNERKRKGWQLLGVEPRTLGLHCQYMKGSEP